METIKNILAWCRRYVSVTLLAVIAFVLFVLFFNENSVMKNFEYKKEIDRLKAEIKINTDSMEFYRRQNLLLQTDPQTMERIVREHYHMQRPDEDVYVFK